MSGRISSRTPTPVAILTVVAFGVFIAADDLTVVSTMFRQIILDLEIPLPAGLSDAAWIVNAYLIAYVAVMPFVGRISDLLGRRPVFISALVLFMAGSIWVPFATELPAFIAGRVLTALGGGAMVPVGMAIIGDAYSPARRSVALGTLGAIDTAGWVWGPLYGALLIRFLDWRWQFYLNIPLSLICIVAAWWAFQGLPKPQLRQRIDWLGTLLLTAALVSLSVALLGGNSIQGVDSLAGLSEQKSSSALPLYAAALLFIAIFVLWERRLGRQAPESIETGRVVKAPLIDLGLLKRINFAPAISVNFLVGTFLIVVMINVPLFINVVILDLEQAALSSGLLLSTMTASMALMADVGGRLTQRWSYRPVATIGLAACVLGLFLIGTSWTADPQYAQMAWQMAILGAGFGLVIAPIGAAVINSAPSDQRGIASSLVIVLRLVGMSVGLASLTAWGLERFNQLRLEVALPKITDPAFQSAAVEALTQTTILVLTETFLICAVIACVALLIAMFLRRDDSP
jgi:EmrB/QacA subfamily drug resistance transporter